MTLGWDNPTADPTTTILLRHGDTQLSPEHRFSGVRDLPLSANGTRQAQAAACRLATGAPIDAVVSSPLQRAVATAAIAAGELGLTAVIDDDLRETDFGDWDGFTLAEIQQRWPKSDGTTPDLPPSIASTTPATCPDSSGRGRAEGAEELVAEGVHWLERSGGTGQQPVLPAPGGNLPEHGRVVGDDRDHYLVAGPGEGDRGSGLLVAEQDEHEVWVVELGDP